MHQLDRIANWLLDQRPPAYPADRIDPEARGEGERIYDQQCASCHDVGGSTCRAGHSDRADRHRPVAARQLHAAARHHDEQRSARGSRGLSLTSARRTATRTHRSTESGCGRRTCTTGASRTLRALLFPKERPTVFYTGYDVYDWKDVGFITSGAAAKREGFRYDTRERGNGNEGHMYGTDLPAAQRLAIIEYLKTK